MKICNVLVGVGGSVVVQAFLIHVLGFRVFFFRNWKGKASYVRLNIISWKQGTGKLLLTCIEIKTCGRKHTG